MASLTFNPDHSRTLDKAVSLIEVHKGSLIVTETDNPVVLREGESKSYEGRGVASLTLYSPASAVVNVTYADEPLPAHATAPRGDTGGTGGGFESRTDKELRKLAAEREIPGRSKMSKAELIEALRK